MTSSASVTPVSHRRNSAAPEAAAERRRLAVMITVALALRLAALTFGHTYKFAVTEDHFAFGWETGRLARSIALGQGFSNPFHELTGPSAWIAPLYPYFLAAIFKVFGIYSEASAWVALAVNSVFSSFTCVTLFYIGRHTFGETVGKWAAWIWALMPYAVYWAIRFAWETSLATFLLSAVFLLALRLAQESRRSWWLAFGALWGLIALSNPSLLAFLPFSGFWIVHRQRRLGILRFAPVVLAGTVFVALLSPWVVRNYLEFHHFILVRGNFGAELRLGNGPNADGSWMYWLHPSKDQAEMRKYVALGEVAYAQQREQEAVGWIRENPRVFAAISLKRAFFFWFGTPRATNSAWEYFGRNVFFSLSSILALLGLLRARRAGKPEALLFLWLFVSIPTLYYFTFTHPRYRHPIEPEMLILAVYVFIQGEVDAPKSLPASTL